MKIEEQTLNTEKNSVSGKQKLEELEAQLQNPDFWADKEKAQETLKEIREIKVKLSSLNKYDKGDAVVSIYAGAGGEDAEDWARMLFDMYQKFSVQKGWSAKILHEHKNDYSGLRNVTFEILGSNVYGQLKGEMGVHRLVRVSPFSAKKLRHTSFALVEIMPRFVEEPEIELRPEEVEVDFTCSSGPGGQNVNKRETAVRIKHVPTGINVRVESERSQAQNRERAMALVKSKLYALSRQYKKEELEKLKITKKTEPEWGNQIRSYVLHPYKMVKDHRTNIETSDIEGVLAGGLDEFVKAEEKL
ncbi:PCRF domain-containing protein [Patescibacteria group bacterium]|nr:PCRF domain-containing protein [Patescibacteria group bacterium]